MVRLFLVLFLGGFATLSLLSCQEHPSLPSAPREVTSMVLVVDASASSGDALNTSIADLRCSEVAGLAQQRLLHSKRLDVLVLATGSRATANEPRMVVPWLRFAPTFKQFGQADAKSAPAESFLVMLTERCRSTLVAENSSPIVTAIERGALSLASHCAELTHRHEICSSRQLITLSDLRENVRHDLRERLIAVSKALRLGKPLPPLAPALTPISVDGNLSVCGLSEHVAGKDDLAVTPEAVVMVWHELLGPSTVFDPTCPRFTVPEKQSATTAGGGR